MARTDRLFLLLQMIRRLPQPVTAARLAEETGVSLRSIYRDINALRAGGALIDGEAGIGYTLTEDPALPPQMFTRTEVEALVLGLSEVGQMSDPELKRAAEDALAKIIASLPERVQRQAIHTTAMVHHFHKKDMSTPYLTLLRDAAWEERAVDLAYEDASGVVTERRIWPLTVVFLDHALTCLAWCCLRQDFRQFRTERMQAVVLSDESFRPKRVPMLRDYLARLRGGVKPR